MSYIIVSKILTVIVQCFAGYIQCWGKKYYFLRGSNRQLEKTAWWWASWFVLCKILYMSDGWACGMQGREVHAKFWLEHLKIYTTCKNLSVDGRMILKYTLKEEDLFWMCMAEYKDRWKVLGIMVMKLWDPYNVGNFMTNWRPICFSRTSLLHGVCSFITVSVIVSGY